MAKTVEPSNDGSAAAVKKPYSKPVLVKHGDIAEITGQAKVPGPGDFGNISILITS